MNMTRDTCNAIASQSSTFRVSLIGSLHPNISVDEVLYIVFSAAAMPILSIQYGGIVRIYMWHKVAPSTYWRDL